MRERIESFLNSLTDKQIVDLWNDYCDKTNNCERYIFPMCEINDFFTETMTPFDVMYKMYPCIHEGLFNPSDDYFCVDRLGNYYSDEFPSDIIPCIYETLALYIIEHKKDFDIAAIAEIIKEDE